MRDMFDDYVRTRTLHNWKFWVVSSLGQGGVSVAASLGYAWLQAQLHRPGRVLKLLAGGGASVPLPPSRLWHLSQQFAQ